MGGVSPLPLTFTLRLTIATRPKPSQSSALECTLNDLPPTASSSLLGFSLGRVMVHIDKHPSLEAEP